MLKFNSRHNYLDIYPTDVGTCKTCHYSQARSLHFVSICILICEHLRHIQPATVCRPSRWVMQAILRSKLSYSHALLGDYGKEEIQCNAFVTPNQIVESFYIALANFRLIFHNLPSFGIEKPWFPSKTAGFWFRASSLAWPWMQGQADPAPIENSCSTIDMKLKPTLSLKLSCSTLGRLKTWCMITKHVYVSLCKAYTWFACTHAGKGFGSPRWLRSVNSTARKPPKASLKSPISTVILGWTCPRKTFPYSKVKYIQGFQGKLWATLMLSCLYIICKIWSWMRYYTVLCKFRPLIPMALILNVSHPRTLLGTHTMVFSSTWDGTVGLRMTLQYGWLWSSTKLARKAIHQPWIIISSQYRYMICIMFWLQVLTKIMGIYSPHVCWLPK